MPTQYVVYLRDDGNAFSGAGALSNPTASGATLSLGNRGQTTLTVTGTAPFAMSAASADFRVWARHDGSLAMLCDPASTPGATSSRYALVAATVASGGAATTQLVQAASLAGKTLYQFAHCSYMGASGSQNQDTAHDANTVSLSFDATGNATRSNAAPGEGPYFVDTALDLQLGGGTVVNGRSVSAFRISSGGTERYVVIERTGYDEIGFIEGSLTLWVDD